MLWCYGQPLAGFTHMVRWPALQVGRIATGQYLPSDFKGSNGTYERQRFLLFRVNGSRPGRSMIANASLQEGWRTEIDCVGSLRFRVRFTSGGGSHDSASAPVDRLASAAAACLPSCHPALASKSSATGQVAAKPSA